MELPLLIVHFGMGVLHCRWFDFMAIDLFVFVSKELMCPSQASERKKLPLDGVLRRCLLGITWRVLASARKNLARDSV